MKMIKYFFYFKKRFPETTNIFLFFLNFVGVIR